MACPQDVIRAGSFVIPRRFAKSWAGTRSVQWEHLDGTSTSRWHSGWLSASLKSQDIWGHRGPLLVSGGAAAAFLVVAFVCISHHCVSVSDLFCTWQGKSRNVCQATVLPQGQEFCKEKAQNDLDFSIFTSGNVCTLFLLSPLTYGTF